MKVFIDPAFFDEISCLKRQRFVSGISHLVHLAWDPALPGSAPRRAGTLRELFAGRTDRTRLYGNPVRYLRDTIWSLGVKVDVNGPISVNG
ncbi:hypothetical protein ES703_52967 [subsurface metagenome]